MMSILTGFFLGGGWGLRNLSFIICKMNKRRLKIPNISFSLKTSKIIMYFCWYRSFYLPTMTQRKEAESQSSITNVYFTLLLGKLSSASLNSVMLA